MKRKLECNLQTKWRLHNTSLAPTNSTSRIQIRSHRTHSQNAFAHKQSIQQSIETWRHIHRTILMFPTCLQKLIKFCLHAAPNIFKETFIAVKRFWSPIVGSRFCRIPCTKSESIFKCNGFGPRRTHFFIWAAVSPHYVKKLSEQAATSRGFEVRCWAQDFARIRAPIQEVFSNQIVSASDAHTFCLGCNKPTLCQSFVRAGGEMNGFEIR